MKVVKKDLTAIILCGGKGERLRPITNNLPKPLIVFGVNNNVELQTYDIYLGEPSETSTVPMKILERADGTSFTAVLMGFDGRWWQVR